MIRPKTAHLPVRGRLTSVAEELRRRVGEANMLPDPGDEKEFPSAADRLEAFRAGQRVPPGPAPAAPPSDAAPGHARSISYSLDLPGGLEAEIEEKLRGEAELRQKTFSSRLVRLVEARHVRPAAFYRAAGIDRKLFSAIRRSEYYQPSRDTAIRCCLALRLNAEETDALLASAGYALSDARRFDIIVRGCIEKGVFGVDEVNTVLDALGERTFR